ncbi:protein of unknown function DUF2800 [Vibrio phage 141O35-1]|nr:protein of unknown function DUF2800 [Vibrio phage 141O35-1]CAH9016032.1 protein of unknown function DUF2800 [Vibrio phage 141E35-1]
MLHETLKHVAPLCDALESNIMDGDDATVQEQASELIVWTQTLQTLFDVEPSNPRKALEALDESIASLQAVRKQVFAAVEQRVLAGEDVEGFTVKSGTSKRSIPDYPAAVMLLESAAGIPSGWMYEQKPLGLPAIEKLLVAQKIKPEAREALLAQFVTVTEGKSKVVLG